MVTRDQHGLWPVYLSFSLSFLYYYYKTINFIILVIFALLTADLISIILQLQYNSKIQKSDFYFSKNMDCFLF